MIIWERMGGTEALRADATGHRKKINGITSFKCTVHVVQVHLVETDNGWHSLTPANARIGTQILVWVSFLGFKCLMTVIFLIY